MEDPIITLAAILLVLNTGTLVARRVIKRLKRKTQPRQKSKKVRAQARRRRRGFRNY